MATTTKIILSLIMSVFTACAIAFSLDKVVIGANKPIEYLLKAISIVPLVFHLVWISRIEGRVAKSLIIIIFFIGILVPFMYHRLKAAPQNGQQHYILQAP